MLLETLDVRKNDVLIYSQNKFDFRDNFKLPISVIISMYILNGFNNPPPPHGSHLVVVWGLEYLGNLMGYAIWSFGSW